MSLSTKAIEDFMRIYKEEFGIELTDSEAHEYATNLIKYFEILIKIDKRTTKAKKPKKYLLFQTLDT